MFIVSSRTNVLAADEGNAYPLTSSGATCREVISLGYQSVDNTTQVLPQYALLNSSSGPGPAADGTYDITTHDMFNMVIGPAGASAAGVFHQCWPSHPKANLSGRFIIPPGWLLVVSPADADMDGIILHTCITQEC